MSAALWTKLDPETGDRIHVSLIEHDPGVYRVSAEVMHQLMREAGWTELEADR